VDGRERCWHQGSKHGNVIAGRVNDEYRQRETGEVLLVFEVAVKP
jgi:hypothetical protein